MSDGIVVRDERTSAVENASFRWSYYALSFGLLGIVIYRSFVHGEAPWDLLALVVIGGGLNAAYQGSHRILSRRWVLITLITIGLATVVAAGLVLTRGQR